MKGNIRQVFEEDTRKMRNNDSRRPRYITLGMWIRSVERISEITQSPNPERIPELAKRCKPNVILHKK